MFMLGNDFNGIYNSETCLVVEMIFFSCNLSSILMKNSLINQLCITGFIGQKNQEYTQKVLIYV